MECNKDEAIRAKEIAEKKMQNNDFQGARNIALKAKNLYPELDNISQLITVCDVHCSSLKKINGSEKDFYGILQIENLADETIIKKQYRKLALLLHPDKNKFPGAEAAFKLIGEANMTLSDKGKRSVYDAKCRLTVKPTVTKPQNRQNGAYDRKQFNGVNHHHQPPPPPPPRDPSLPPSFWTFCPFCSIKYEYYREFVNRALRCQHCQKLFIAHDLAAHGPVPGARQSQPQQPPMSHAEQVKRREKVVSQMEELRRREKVKVNIQKERQVPSNYTHQTSNPKTEASGVGGSSRTVPKMPVKTEPGKDTKKKRSRKIATESSESEAEGGIGVNPAGDHRKSSRQKQQVSYDENAPDELNPQKRPRKLPTDVEDSKNEKEKEKEKEEESSKADMDMEDDVSMPNGNHDDDSDSEPEFVECLDLEFSNFDKEKEEDCFKVDQIWACYDSVDGMPRFYARIKKIFTRNFKLKFTWLEADPDTEPEKKWAEEGLPVGCGKFTVGETEETKDRLMFSHQIVYKNGPKRNSFFIYPQKGEIWAMFKDWDINWGSDPQNHTKYKFDIVEIGDVDDNDGNVSVALLVKVKGFVSLFQKTVWGGLGDRKITKKEVLRFSHKIPCFKLTGNERAGVPPGSFELDTASLPNDLEEYYYSIDNNVDKVNVNPTTPKKNVKGKNGIEKDPLNLRRSPRGLKNGVDPTATSSSDGNLPKGPQKTVHDFSRERKIWKFCSGQVWAFWEENNQSYGQILKLETDPFRLEVCVLKSVNIKLNACGTFKKNPLRAKIVLPPDVFSHVVKAEESGGTFKIYPKEQQIWALKEDNGDCTSVVEVLESDESSVKVLSLTRVNGYKSVFKGPRVQRSSDNIVVVPKGEINRFLRQIPAFLFTEEKDGELRGCWELDPVALAGLRLHEG